MDTLINAAGRGDAFSVQPALPEQSQLFFPELQLFHPPGPVPGIGFRGPVLGSALKFTYSCATSKPC